MATAAGPVSTTRWQPKAQAGARDPRFDMAFGGILGYLLIEYTRLPAMYPILQPLNLGKVSIVLAALGMLLTSGTRRRSRTLTRMDWAVSAWLLAAVISL